VVVATRHGTSSSSACWQRPPHSCAVGAILDPRTVLEAAKEERAQGRRGFVTGNAAGGIAKGMLLPPEEKCRAQCADQSASRRHPLGTARERMAPPQTAEMRSASRRVMPGAIEARK